MRSVPVRVALILLVCTAGSIPAQTAKPIADWTIMVFMNAKNNLEEDAIGNFLQMAEVANSDNVNVLVEFGRPKKHITRSYGPWDGTRIFLVRQHMTPGDHPVKDVGEIDMGSGRSVADFVTWCRKLYPAHHYALVIWDHGQGWRFRYANTFALRAAAASGRAANIPTASAGIVRSGFRSVSHDDQTGHVIYNRDLADSLQRVLAGERLSVLAFDACLMGMIETAYAMRGVADYMVGSEELEPGAGWDYSLVLMGLRKSASTDGRGLAALIVDAYREAYGEVHLTTLSAVSLARAKEIGTRISELADSALLALPARRNAIAAARAACSPYGASDGLTNTIDIGCFIDHVLSTPTLNDLHTPARKVQASLSDGVVRNYASRREITEGPGGTGLAIYFPPDVAAHKSDPDHDGYETSTRKYPVEFVEHERWAPFVRAFLALQNGMQKSN